MRDGILLLNKPKEWTSHDCVALCRRTLKLKGVKKIGHGGTLDPNAEGLLPIFIGQATRIMEYMDLEYKTYFCRARLGITTDTQDIWGKVIGKKSIDGIERRAIEEALASFSGVIEQVAPVYSAVRIEGKRLYEYARAGNAPREQIPTRRVHISDIIIDDVDEGEGRVDFTVRCSRGTYVRTICNDMGEKIGCGAVMEELKRTAVGSLDLERSISPVDIKELKEEEIDDRIGPLIIPPDEPLKKFGRAFLPRDRADYFSHGNSSHISRVRIEEEPQIQVDMCSGKIPQNARGKSYDRIYCVYEEGTGLFLGTGYLDDEGLLRADKVFIKGR